MCFSKPKPPPPTKPDPSLEASKAAQAQENARMAAEEKARALDDAQSRAYGFFGQRSLLTLGPSGGSSSLLKPMGQ